MTSEVNARRISIVRCPISISDERRHFVSNSQQPITNIDSLDSRLQVPLHNLKSAVDTTRSNTTTKFANSFATKADADRTFLQNASLPADEANHFCLGCGHHCVDELDTNKDMLKKNLENLKEHEQQATRDKSAWAGGQQS